MHSQNQHGHSKGTDCFLQVGDLSLSPVNALPLSLGELNLDFPNWEMKTLVMLILKGLEPPEWEPGHRGDSQWMLANIQAEKLSKGLSLLLLILIYEFTQWTWITSQRDSFNLFTLPSNYPGSNLLLIYVMAITITSPQCQNLQILVCSLKSGSFL